MDVCRLAISLVCMRLSAAVSSRVNSGLSDQESPWHLAWLHHGCIPSALLAQIGTQGMSRASVRTEMLELKVLNACIVRLTRHTPVGMSYKCWYCTGSSIAGS